MNEAEWSGWLQMDDDGLAEKQRALYRKLDELGVVHETHRHAPVFTVEEAQALREDVPGAHTKNLFLRDKKGKYFLVVLEETAEVDLKSLHGRIGGQGRVSFGKPEKLMEYLGVTPGSVTSLAVMNDVDNQVALVIDERLLEAEIINAHPLSNDATTSLKRDDLLRFVVECGHDPLILNLGN